MAWHDGGDKWFPLFSGWLSGISQFSLFTQYVWLVSQLLKVLRKETSDFLLCCNFFVAANGHLTKNTLDLSVICFGCKLKIDAVWKAYRVLMNMTTVSWSSPWDCVESFVLLFTGSATVPRRSIQKQPAERQRPSTIQALLKFVIKSMHPKTWLSSWRLH